MSVKVLEETLNKVFTSMTDGKAKTFSDGIANAVVVFVSSGIVQTIDGGTVTGGTFAGSGTGSLTVTPVKCSSIIESACTTMKTMTSGGNDYLAQEIGKALKQMADDGKVITTVTGTLTPPSSSPVTFGGSASGSIKCSEIYLVTALKTLFTEMYDKREEDGYDGNAEFAKKLASEINTFFTSGTVSTDGSGNLSGSKGSGSFSFIDSA